ncbi:hypothetical protein BGZ46_007271, partial [Entomortierella lignicola]
SVQRQLQSFQEFMDMQLKQFNDRPQQINIHVLKSVVLQYSPNDRPNHSKAENIRFIFSCQTQSGSMGSLGSTSDNHHHHQLHQQYQQYPGHDDEADSQNTDSDYQSSAFIHNVYFKTASKRSRVSGPPPLRSFSSRITTQRQQDEGGCTFPMAQLSLSRSGVNANDNWLVIPCPFEPNSDSASEGTPPPSDNRDLTGKGSSRSQPIKIEDDETSSSTGYSGSYLRDDRQGMDFDGQMEWSTDSRLHYHQHGKHISSKRPYITSSGSNSKHRRYRASRNWCLGIQTYYYERAAMNAMVLAAKEYMESREDEQCSIVERTDTTRIIWNDSTKQELIWTVTPTLMDRTNPGEHFETEYDPNWRENPRRQ